MHLIIDFDYTLFDTNRMRAALVKTLAPWDVTLDVYMRMEKKCMEHALYDVNAHLRLLVPKQMDDARRAFDGVLRHGDRFLYNDSIKFLRRHKKAGHTLTILSFGSHAWQQQKIDGADIASLADDVVITDKPKEKIIKGIPKDERLIMLDDRGTVLDVVKKQRPQTFAIWMRRPNAPYRDEPCASYDSMKKNLNFDVEKIWQ